MSDEDDQPRLTGASAAMILLRRRIAQVARTPLPVLITGETGTGKEAVARTLHELSGRSGPFIPVDCASLSMSLVETELFGHERGAFTGANQRREGLVYAARGGTFFLDEVGELPMETQTRLLRLLEQSTYRPVGDQVERKAQGETIVIEEPEAEPEKVPDLMAALEASIASAKKPAPKKKSGSAKKKKEPAKA